MEGESEQLLRGDCCERAVREHLYTRERYQLHVVKRFICVKLKFHWDPGSSVRGEVTRKLTTSRGSYGELVPVEFELNGAAQIYCFMIEQQQHTRPMHTSTAYTSQDHSLCVVYHVTNYVTVLLVHSCVYKTQPSFTV